MSHEPIIVAVFIGGDEAWDAFHQGKVGKRYTVDRGNLDAEIEELHKYDVVLADVSVLTRDELAALVRNLGPAEIPVLAVTNESESNVANDALDAGAHDVIQIPATVEVLRARLGSLARLYRRDQRLARRAADRFRLLQQTLPLIMYEGELDNGDSVRLSNFRLWMAERDADIEASMSDHDEWRSRIHPDDVVRYEDALRAVRSGELPSWSVEYRWARTDPEGDEEPDWVWMFDRGARASLDGDGGEVIGFVLDVSERKSLESQLARAQKMEAIGRLAGGVAHDFNNLLTAIINFTWYVRDELPDGSELRGDLGEVLKAAESGAYLTSQLLAFSRRQPVEPAVIELNDRIRTLHEVLRRTLGENIEVVVEPAAQSLRVSIDPGQFDQLLFNLAVNSRDAMPSGGTLYVRLDRDGDEAVMEVTDTGEGIDDAVIEEVFDPFFSTKGESGTGLGLATCYGIVRQAGGDITVRSQAGEGASFEIRLPLDDAESFSGTDEYDPVPTAHKDALALVVEDQPAILMMTKRALTRAGFEVEGSPTAEDALSVAENFDDQPTILVSDVILPGLSGPKLAKRLRKKWPKLPVLLMSGYLGDERNLEIGDDERTAFLPKPFAPAQFLAAVARLTSDEAEEE